MLYDYFSIALSNITHRKVRSWLTMIGIFIGIAAVVSLIGLGEGLRISILSQFSLLGTDVLSVQAEGLGVTAGPPGSGVVEPLDSSLVDKIRKVKGVDVAFNRYLQAGTLEFDDRQGIGIAASIPLGDERKALENMLNLQTSDGRLLQDGDNSKVMVGSMLAEEDTFGIRAGDKVLIDDKEFEVVGVLESKGSFILDGSVYMNEDVMINKLDVDKDEVNIIAVRVKDVDEINQVQADIEKLLRKERGVKEGDENFIVQSPQSALGQLNSILFGVQLFVYIIATISLLVGGIGIMNTMYTAVLERTKEIGIMKSIGARNSAIFSLFFIESGLLGLVGGIIGVLIGIGLAEGLAYAGRNFLGGLIQASIGWPLILGALAFSFVLGTIFGVLPAWRASKLNPIDSLRSVK